jgi:F-type H+-transporting ATPase subunit b
LRRRLGGGLCAGVLLGIGLIQPIWADQTTPATPAPETHAADAAHEGSAPNILDVDPGLMFWTAVTFVILLVILRATAWKPLIGALDAREQRIRDSIDNADRIKQEAEGVLQRYEAMLDTAKSEAQQIIDEGKSDALALKRDMIAQARNEAEEFKARARREVDLAADAAKKELWDEASRLSTLLAQRILERNVDSNDHRRLVEQVLNEFRDARTSKA